jgi:hypothetical protein
MENWIDLEKLDVMKFARSIERDCQEPLANLAVIFDNFAGFMHWVEPVPEWAGFLRK